MIHRLDPYRRTVETFLLAALGVVWYLASFGGSFSFHPLDLGLDPLTLVVFVGFLTSVVIRGYTARSVVLLALPAAACLALRHQLTAFAELSPLPGHFDPLAWRAAALMSLGYLWLLLTWLFAFPIPSQVYSADAVRAAQWKRAEQAAAVLYIAFLAYQTMKVAFLVPSRAIEAALPFWLGARMAIKFGVLFLYFLFLLRAFLHFTPVTSNQIQSSKLA